MNDLGIEYYDAVRDEVRFLLDHQSLLDRIEFLVAKPLKSGLDVTGDDLPKELTELRLQLARLAAHRQTLELHNEIIWALMHQRKQDSETLRAALEAEAKVEVHEWVKLVEHFTEQLKAQDMVCHFCNAPLAKLNSKCKANMSVPQDASTHTTQHT